MTGCHLGDLPGDPPVPIERDRRPPPRRPINVAAPVGLALALAAMMLSAVMVGGACGAERGPVKVPKACERLAREAGFPPVLSPDDQDRAIAQLAKGYGPEVRTCRAAVEQAMRRGR